MIPLNIHQVYLGTPPPSMVAMMGGVISMNPHWQHRMWTEDNLGLLGYNYTDLLKTFGAPVHVSDFIRLEAVYRFGGMYLDCDCEAIAPLDSLAEYDAVAAFQDGTGQICPAVFGATIGHPWLEWQIRMAKAYSKPNEPWNVGLMTDAPRHGVTIVPTDTFYPWLWTTKPEDRKPTERTLVIHHWKGTWAPWFKREYPT